MASSDSRTPLRNADDDDFVEEEEILLPVRRAVPPQDDDKMLVGSMRNLSLRPATTSSPRPTAQRKLIILDLNGLLCDRERNFTRKSPLAGGHSFIIYARPHAITFLDFLFERFDVAVWSSARLPNIYPILNELQPDESKRPFVFIWGQDQCTEDAPLAETPKKPLFLKRLAKVWETYPEYVGRTLLVDDSVAKVRDNPPFTAIHPREWTRHTADDQALAPDSYLRAYLEALHAAPDAVAAFVQARPFSQPS